MQIQDGFDILNAEIAFVIIKRRIQIEAENITLSPAFSAGQIQTFRFEFNVPNDIFQSQQQFVSRRAVDDVP